ncbi:CPBP family intramembrane metalloprotease [Microbispora hainanensis]|uniref:CPBP family intramembrane glutamic endopeptidase n=1 Tax=Microbispora TaxID=2005 RepID=UPI00115AD074|nr:MULTISPECIES: CPBP family intramembrane glutamic endopeptidase [Microbispora]NJP24274.1 CPBP family intramembrane metalloprotease [Microbispora sp. CL1-1]TQS15070.1 CPBP family intramembrane metalloprotease [Microbispora sp. SCL1-1]
MKPATAAVLGVLAAANVLNNRVARRWAPLTSAVATGALVLIARREGVTWRELGFRHARAGAVTGGALAAGVAAVYAAGVACPRTRALFRDERALALSRRRVLEEALVQVPLGTVLLEEVGFRGALPALLGRSLPPGAAVAVSAALFGLWHVLPAVDMAAANPALGRPAAGETPDEAAPQTKAGRLAETGRLVAGTVASTAVAGLVFHGLRHRAGLLAPALLHVATNSLGYAAARVARRLDQPSRGSARPVR